MKLEHFVDIAHLKDVREVDKVVLIAFFFLQTEGKVEFIVHEAAGWLHGLGFSKPNLTRLRDHLKSSPDCLKGGSAESFRLHRNAIDRLAAEHPDLAKNEDIVHQGSIIPESVFTPSRGYIESLCRQINSAFENNIFDGCAVLMRRLMEVLLIHSFEHAKSADEIKDGDGNFLMLERILDRVRSTTAFSLSRNSKETLEVFRKLGNFSAHKIQYSCRKDDIKKVAIDYRALVEELLYKSGVRK
jgi:hypothetical protein